jgi:serine protease Do
MSEKAKKQPEHKPLQPPGVQTLGMTLNTITPALREKYKLGEKVSGVVITAVKPNGIAASQNIQPGDVILQTGQSRVTTPAEVVAEISVARKAKRGAVLFMVERGTDRIFVALPLKAGG